jgi:protein-glutamine gamma-glutamyltransferase
VDTLPGPNYNQNGIRMSFGRTFKLLSYAAVFCGFASLWITGTFGLAGTALFVGTMALAWLLEGTRWQLSERAGTVLIVLAMPVYYLLWRMRFFDLGAMETMLPGILARLILTLTAIKLLQKKSDRDWIFLYVMAFFQVLLAAGMSISALYLGTFVAYVFVMVSTIIVFEIRRSERGVAEAMAANGPKPREADSIRLPLSRLPMAAAGLILAMILIAVPMFFMLPRVGGAGIGGQGGPSTSSGFSDTVRLGNIGRIQQNDAVVMRVRLDDPRRVNEDLKWRGLALDHFDNFSWRKSRAGFREVREKGERDVIQVDYLTGREGLLLQTFYLEPIDSQVLFVLPRAVGIQGNFPVLFKDQHDSISFHSRGERITYKVLSETSLPTPDELRRDRGRYGREESIYLQLPQEIDPRIEQLAAQVTASSTNRFDAASAVERYLQTQFGYTLEQKAGGAEPLADFLFNVREGHCEYFATAMAVMLRTQGIATRVVNGFQRGEYNETADVFVVRQLNAHSWVEVYFPEEQTWVPFDPTPAAGQNLSPVTFGMGAFFGRYMDALEMFWIQYFVAFDNQEQQSLFTSVKRSAADYNERASGVLRDVQDAIAAWWRELRGDQGSAASLTAAGYGAAILAAIAAITGFLIWAYRRIKAIGLLSRLKAKLKNGRGRSTVEFYRRMEAVLASKGLTRQPHQTPLEFAYAVGMPEAVFLTKKYNGVRFGEKALSQDEAAEIATWLERLQETELLSGEAAA